MTTELIASTDLLTTRPVPALVAAQPDDEADHEWLEFLSLGLRLDATGPIGQAAWRNAPVLLSY